MIDQAVQSRLDAYRGNPQALAQRYQMSQDLLDLLALQKLKSEKEAAAREMQLQMAQQQGQPPTVAQQREQEVMNMTKQELAQQVGQVGQQQMQQQQAALQRMMSGLAAAPGAQNVMPEQAMAAGGIVAFQEGGTPEDQVTPEGKRELTDEEKEYIRMLESDETRRLMARYARPEPSNMAERAQRQREEKGSIYSPDYGLTPSERVAAQMRRGEGLPQLLERMRPRMPLGTQVSEAAGQAAQTLRAATESLGRTPETREMSYFKPAQSAPAGAAQASVGGQAMPEDRGGGEAPAPREAPPVAAQPTAAPAAAQPAGLDALRTALAQKRRTFEEIYNEVKAQYPNLPEEEVRKMVANVTAARERATRLQQGPGLMELLIAAAQGMAGRRRGREFEGSAAALSQLTASRRAEAEKAEEIARQREEGLINLLQRQREAQFGAAQGRMTEEQRAETARIGDAVRLAGVDAQAAANEEARLYRAMAAANADYTKRENGYRNAVQNKVEQEQKARARIEKLKAEDMEVKAKRPGAEAKYDTALSIELQEIDRAFGPILRRYQKDLGYEMPQARTTTAAPVNTQGFLLKNVR
jgi:hypothetical protein